MHSQRQNLLKKTIGRNQVLSPSVCLLLPFSTPVTVVDTCIHFGSRGSGSFFLSRQYRNVLEAAAAGASQSIPLVANIAANLIAFLGLLSFVNATIGWFGSFICNPDLSFEVDTLFWHRSVWIYFDTDQFEFNLIQCSLNLFWYSTVWIVWKLLPIVLIFPFDFYFGCTFICLWTFMTHCIKI